MAAQVYTICLPPVPKQAQGGAKPSQPLSAPQLEKEEQIHSVDIGNDGSAFVEVLVGSSAGGATAGEQDYEVSSICHSGRRRGQLRPLCSQALETAVLGLRLP